MVVGDEDRLAQHRVTAARRAAVVAAHARCVERGTSPLKERTPARGRKAVGVAEAGEDLRAGDRAHARHGGEDPVRVGLLEQQRDALVECGDLVCDGEGEPGRDGDVLAELVEVERVLPERERLLRRS
ncbi:MAG: hypothetical protein OXG95_00275 [Chloroflexi bacterium]|nr:hypothetical protein [Chloroflexota bacterium]